MLLSLEQCGYAVNPLKFEWTINQIDYIGILLTPDDIKPIPTKIDAIMLVAHVSSFENVYGHS